MLMLCGENCILRTAYSQPLSSKIGIVMLRISHPFIKPSDPAVAKTFCSYLHQSQDKTLMKMIYNLLNLFDINSRLMNIYIYTKKIKIS